MSDAPLSQLTSHVLVNTVLKGIILELLQELSVCCDGPDRSIFSVLLFQLHGHQQS